MSTILGNGRPPDWLFRGMPNVITIDGLEYIDDLCGLVDEPWVIVSLFDDLYLTVVCWALTQL